MKNIKPTISLEEVNKLKKIYQSIYDENSTPFPGTEGRVTQFNDIVFSKPVNINPNTSPKDIGIILENWHETLTQTPTYSEPTVTKTTFDKDESADLIEKAEIRNRQIEETRINAEKEIERARLRQEEIIKQQKNLKQKQEQLNKLDQLPDIGISIKTGEKVPTVSLTPTEKEVLFVFIEQAKKDPSGTKHFIEEQILKTVTLSTELDKNLITPEVVEKTSLSVVETLRAIPDFESSSNVPDNFPSINPTSPFSAFTDDGVQIKKLVPDNESRESVIEAARAISLVTEADTLINFSLAKGVFGEKISSVFFGPSDGKITQFQIDENRDNNHSSINLREMFKTGNKIRKLLSQSRVGASSMTSFSRFALYSSTSPTLTATVSILTKALPVIGAYAGLRNSTLIPIWTNNHRLLTGFKGNLLIGNSTSQSIRLSSFVVPGRRILIFTKSNFFMFGLSTGKTAAGKTVILNSGLKIGQSTIITTATTAGTEIATTGFFSKIGSFLAAGGGLVGVVVGAVVGALIGKIIEKINWAKVKKWLSDNGPVLLGIGGLVFMGPVVGTGLFIGGLLFTGGLAGVTVGIVAGLGSLWSKIILPVVVTPIIVGFLILVPLVAFMLFVINSGAYVLPQNPMLDIDGADNPYIMVTKTASVRKMTNPTTPQTVTYTVTIKALKGLLTNLSITSTECRVIKRNKTNLPCPVEILPDLPSDLEISPSNEYTFAFNMQYDSKFNDALIFDSVSVKADTLEQKNVKTTGSESICIGDCPIDCVVVSDAAKKWPTNLRSNSETALGDLSSQYQGFMANVCRNNEKLNLCYDPSKIKAGYYAWHAGERTCDVYFNKKGVGSANNALFMITHELTHHIQAINGGSVNIYKSSGAYKEVGSKGFCTYEDTKGNVYESMAEANGLFAAIPSWGSCVSNYSKQYPRNYNYAKKFMK